MESIDKIINMLKQLERNVSTSPELFHDGIDEDILRTIDYVKDTLKDLKQEINDCYELKKFNPYCEYGISEDNFH